MRSPAAGTQHTHGTTFTVGAFDWSPDGARIAFSAQSNPDLVQGSTADVYVITLASDSVRRIVDQPGPDGSPLWSPDGQWIAFVSKMGRQPFFITNSRIAVVPAEGGAVRSLTDAFDENPNASAWKAHGIYFRAAARTASHVFRVDPQTTQITRVSGPAGTINQTGSLNANGTPLAVMSSGPASLAELSVSTPCAWPPMSPS